MRNIHGLAVVPEDREAWVWGHVHALDPLQVSEVSGACEGVRRRQWHDAVFGALAPRHPALDVLGRCPDVHTRVL